ncbi:hypothetical protein [Paraburkholderia sp. 2C]
MLLTKILCGRAHAAASVPLPKAVKRTIFDAPEHLRSLHRVQASPGFLRRVEDVSFLIHGYVRNTKRMRKSFHPRKTETFRYKDAWRKISRYR